MGAPGKTMAVDVEGKREDTVKEACERLGISRNTLLAYINKGIVEEPPTVKKGSTRFRYFPESWYGVNKPKIDAL